MPYFGRSKQEIHEINRLDKTVKQGSQDSYEDIYVLFRYFVAHGLRVNSFRNLLNWKKKSYILDFEHYGLIIGNHKTSKTGKLSSGNFALTSTTCI